MSQRVLVIGSGGIGSFYAALLHKAGWQVEMVARSDHSVIREHGLEIDSPLGDLSFRPEKVYASVEEAGPADWILIAVKILPETDLAALVAPAMTFSTTLCLIANGLDIEAPLAQAYPNNTLLSCVAFVGTTRVRTGVIKHSSYGNLSVGNFLSDDLAPCQLLADSLNRTGIKVGISKDIQQERWKKSIWNASFNPLSVLTNGADTGRLLATAEAEALVRALMSEVIATATAAGYPLAQDLIQKNIATTQAMSPYLTSMAVDYLNGHAIELESLLGSVVRYAHKYAVPIPHLDTLYQALKIRQ